MAANILSILVIHISFKYLKFLFVTKEQKFQEYKAYNKAFGGHKCHFNELKSQIVKVK